MNASNETGVGDPFEEPGLSTGIAAQPSAAGYQGTHTGAPYSSYGRYATGYGAYASGYGGIYSGGTGGAGAAFSPYGGAYAGRYGTIVGGAMQAQAGGAAVLSGMQEAMQRFARVSGLMEEVLRHLHMLFDGIFGLGYSLGAFQEEARMWLAVKSGPTAFLVRMLGKLARLWRLVTIFLCSPFAGEFSPVAFVFRLLGLTPYSEEALLDDDWAAASLQRDDPLSSHERRTFANDSSL